MLDLAFDGCINGEFTAMVTGPVQKSVIIDAGFDFTGHTEYLAARCAVPLPVMLLVDDPLRVALATTHLALADVPRPITRELLDATSRRRPRALDLLSPCPAAHRGLGLNPHAGEGGHLGREEIDVIAPAVEAATRRGLEGARSRCR